MLVTRRVSLPLLRFNIRKAFACRYKASKECLYHIIDTIHVLHQAISFVLFLKWFRTFFFCLFRTTPMAYGGSQARGQIRAVAAALHQSHSNAGSELCLRPTPQLMVMPDPQPTE